MRTVVAVTGASGAVISRRLMENLLGEKLLVMSEHGCLIADHELSDAGGKKGSDQLRSLADREFSNDDLAAPISSGSYRFDRMVIVPCSMSTLSKIACGICDNLVTRAASVCLKEGRGLVIVPRESPVSAIHLDNMAKLARHGVIVLPAMLTFYNRPTSLDEVIDPVVARILDVLGQDNDLAPRWDGSVG